MNSVSKYDLIFIYLLYLGNIRRAAERDGLLSKIGCLFLLRV